MRRAPVTNPVLVVRDLGASSVFYRGLGFAVKVHSDRYAWVTHGGWEFLHLIQSESGGGAGAYVHVSDPDEWHVAMSASAGGDSVGEVTNQPWAMREFAVTDLDGNIVRFGRNT